MFSYLRAFSFVSFLAVLIIAVLVGMYFRSLASTDLRVMAERVEAHDWPKSQRESRRHLRHFIRRESRHARKHAWKCWPPLQAELREGFA